MAVDLDGSRLNRSSYDVRAGGEFRGPILLKRAINEQPGENHQEKIEHCLRVPFLHWLILSAALFICWRSIHFLQNGRFAFGALFILLGWFLLWLAVALFFLPEREAFFLRPVVRTRFQFVVLTGVAVEVQDFLCVFAHVSHHTVDIASEDESLVVSRFGGAISFVRGFTCSPSGSLNSIGSYQNGDAILCAEEFSPDSNRIGVQVAGVESLVSLLIVNRQRMPIVAFLGRKDLLGVEIDYIPVDARNNFCILGDDITRDEDAFRPPLYMEVSARPYGERSKVVMREPHYRRPKKNQDGIWRRRGHVSASICGSGVCTCGQIVMRFGLLRWSRRQPEELKQAAYEDEENRDTYRILPFDKSRTYDLQRQKDDSRPESGCVVFWIEKMQIKRKPQHRRADSAYDLTPLICLIVAAVGLVVWLLYFAH
jgi:hypothetical protein